MAVARRFRALHIVHRLDEIIDAERNRRDEDEAEEAIEQEVYLGNLPYMTEQGTFVSTNGGRSWRPRDQS